MIYALLWGCTAGGKDDTGPGADGAWGVITADRAGELATLSEGAGWAFDSPTNGKAVLYLSANAGLSCDEVGAALGGPEDPDWDRAALLPPETCAIFAYLDYDAAAGGSWTEADGVAATVSVSCAMDAGAWEQSDDCLGSYCYTGHYWQGNPTDYDLSMSGGAGEDYTVTLRMDGYDGRFTYESPDPAPAEGAVAADTSARWCTEIGQTSWFSQ